MSGLKKLLVAGIVVAGLAALIGFSLLQRYLDQPLSMVEQQVVFSVPPGASLTRVAATLGEQQILQHPTVFAWWGRWTGKAEQIKAGEYAIPAEATPRRLMQQLVAGDVIQHAFTIVEGWNIRDLLAALARNENLEHTLPDNAADQLTELLDLPAPHPEGLFFPETYLFPNGFTDLDVLRISAALMQTKLNSAWEGRDPELPLTNAYELLTLASIVERETGQASERAQIAGVFVRRLQKGMLLQTDPTVIYGLGDSFDGNLTREHLRTDTPYNTYTRPGLPPSPIALPGEAALQAAANPAAGTAVFFVASGDGTGGHVFSDTLEQHNAAVADYLSRLREARNNETAGSTP